MKDMKKINLDLNFNLGTKKPDEVLSKVNKVSSVEDIEEHAFDFFDLAFTTLPRRKGVVSPSEIAKENSCLRRAFFKLAGTKKDDMYLPIDVKEPRLRRIFNLGTLLHLYIQRAFFASGMLVEFEGEIESKPLNIYGHYDGIVEIEGKKMLLEIKTMNTFMFQKNVVFQDHINQASIYAHFAGLDKILFCYYDKNISELAFYVCDVDKDYIENTFMPNVRSLRTFKRKNRNKKFDDYVLPEKVCKTKRNKEAQECPYKETCFSHKSI